jgi:hypothetical protein
MRQPKSSHAVAIAAVAPAPINTNTSAVRSWSEVKLQKRLPARKLSLTGKNCETPDANVSMVTS